MENMKAIMECLFGNLWRLMSEVTVPGFEISLAKVIVGFFVIRFSLLLLSIVTGFRSNVGYTAEQFRTSSESASHYRKVREQQKNYAKNGGIGFHD